MSGPEETSGGAGGAAPEFMTTKEVAAYLRIKERRIYELLKQKAIPCTKVTGKWLFPKDLIDLWLAENAEGKTAAPVPPPVIAGSQDPLLDWAVKQSGCGLAMLPGGSLDGIRRFARGEAVAAGLHIFERHGPSFNVATVRAALGNRPVALMEWAMRSQGVIVAPDNPAGIHALTDLVYGRVVRRQATAGSQLLLEELLESRGIDPAKIRWTEEIAYGETDLGMAVLERRADAGFAIEAVANALELNFTPVTVERFDLLARRRDFFAPPLQRLLTFCRSEAFAARAKEMGGYDVSELGRIHFNGV
ncbi:MAG: helix-turn-helix transcriptional regulator [Rhodovibrionaceae bacterium]